MKGILLKDFYIIRRQIVIVSLFLIPLVVLTLSSPSSVTFLVIFILLGAIMPTAALSYDGRSKWDKLQRMLPVSGEKIVMGKYLLGWICAGIGWILAVMGMVVVRAFRPEKDSVPAFTILLMILLASSILEAVMIPIFMKIGPEKGSILMMLICAFMGGIGGILGDIVPNWHIDLQQITAILLAAAVLGNFLSILISMHIYRNQEV